MIRSYGFLGFNFFSAEYIQIHFNTLKFIRIHKDAWECYIESYIESYIEPLQHSKWKQHFQIEIEKFIMKDAVERIGIKELIKQINLTFWITIIIIL